MSERESNELNQQVELAKSLRPLQANAITYVLTPQRSAPGEWEVVQQVTQDGRLSLVFAYGANAPESIIVRPRGLQPDLTYQLRSSDRGVLGRLRGADLIANGLEILQTPESASQVLVLEATAAEGASAVSPQKTDPQKSDPQKTQKTQEPQKTQKADPRKRRTVLGRGSSRLAHVGRTRVLKGQNP